LFAAVLVFGAIFRLRRLFSSASIDKRRAADKTRRNFRRKEEKSAKRKNAAFQRFDAALLSNLRLPKISGSFGGSGSPGKTNKLEKFQ